MAVVSLFLCATPSTLAKTILYVPQDDRPVDYEYTVSTAESAGYTILTPPAQYLSGMNFHGSPDRLMSWVEANANKADAMVLSIDSWFTAVSSTPGSITFPCRPCCRVLKR